MKNTIQNLLNNNWSQVYISHSVLEQERPDLVSNTEPFWIKDSFYVEVDLRSVPNYNWREPIKKSKYHTLEEAYGAEFKN
jgi:hypothetical protein